MRHLAMAVCVLIACKGDKPRPTSDPSPSATPARARTDGPAVTPVITNSVTFVVPKSASWWGEFHFACYRAVMSLTGKADAGDAFEKMSPNVPEAMKAGGIDLGRDLAGMGMFECGGSPCIYVAATIPHPEKMKTVLAKLVPSVPLTEVTPSHFTLETPSTVNSSGTRIIHVRLVPIDWSAVKVPADPWSQEGARATHVVFLTGVDGKNSDVDPMTLLADAQIGAAHVKEAESVLAETQNRCMAGLVGPRDFQPGFGLVRGRFAMAAPVATKPDAMMAMLSSKKTLDIQVDLRLDPPPTEAKATEWIGMGKMFLANIGANVRGQFAGQDATMEMYFDMLSLIGTKAFAHAIDGASLRFSWRTDRIPRGDIEAVESRFESMFGP